MKPATRVSLRADIHGNHVALDVVLEAIDATPVDQIVCLGDVAVDGPARVVRRLQVLDCPVVRGNMDDWAINPGPPDTEDEGPQCIAEVQRWCLSRLSAEDLAVTTSEVDLATRLGDLRPAILASGHTHAAMVRRFEETILVNPGSVGSPSVRMPGGAPPLLG